MKKVCCVCGKDLGEVPGPPERLTHGFCVACYRDQLRLWEERLSRAGTRDEPPRGRNPEP